jgi:tripartite-type tricarboxylate transporter receptor subunit TctC
MTIRTHTGRDGFAPRRTLLLGAAGMAAMAVMPSVATAQGYPTKLVTMIVPYPAGGPSDVSGRQLQNVLQKSLGQTFIVDNVSGAGGTLGVQKVLGAPADGYTLLVGSPMELMQSPLVLSAVRFKPDDMRMVGLLLNTNMILLARKDLEAGTVDELIALAKKKDLTYGSVGPGSMYHLMGETFSAQTVVKMVHVPYKGAAPLVNDLMGGQIDLVFMPLAGGVPGMIEGGKVKALALAARQRHPRFPALPLMSDSKAVGDFAYDLWLGVQVPRTVGADVAQKLNKAINDAVQQPDLRRELEAGGSRVAPPMSLAELDKLYASDVARYAGIAKSLGLKPQ